MSRLRRTFRRSTFPLLLVVCLTAISFSYAFADEPARPLAATDVLGSPDAAVNGKFAVGSSSVGSKALTVIGVIDFLGAGTVHNYFTQGGGNNMQINTNVDEANAVGDATRSQWKMVMGSTLDQFSIRRSPASATYNEDALFWIDGATGNVGIATVDTGNGASIPFTLQARLHVDTASGHGIIGVTTDTTSNWTGVYGESTSTTGNGVFGWAVATTGDAWGVVGVSDSDMGHGVNGWVSSTSGVTFGVYGQSESTEGYGVFGSAPATSGDTTGVHGVSSSPDGTGVFGWASATSGFAVGTYGLSESTDGYGVVGLAAATTGFTSGVYGHNNSLNGVGVYGWTDATSGDGAGVVGWTDSPDGVGLYGYGPGGGGGWAGYFEGDVRVSGTLSKSAGGFRIDHPLDSSKYLNHSFVESPDMKNIYDGVVSLDGAGQATVQLPPWFEALNMDFRYQLTPIGAAMPDLHIAQEIEDNEFIIAGGLPGMKVSWQVTGIRHDPYADAHRIPVEQDKEDRETQGPRLTPPGAAPGLPDPAALPSIDEKVGRP